MSLSSIHEDYLDPDLYLWNEAYTPLRCGCGAFIAEKPTAIETTLVTRFEEDITGEIIEVKEDWTTTHHFCKRCGKTHKESRS